VACLHTISPGQIRTTLKLLSPRRLTQRLPLGGTLKTCVQSYTPNRNETDCCPLKSRTSGYYEGFGSGSLHFPRYAWLQYRDRRAVSSIMGVSSFQKNGNPGAPYNIYMPARTGGASFSFSYRLPIRGFGG
jgi:hypothetical protein